MDRVSGRVPIHVAPTSVPGVGLNTTEPCSWAREQKGKEEKKASRSRSRSESQRYVLDAIENLLFVFWQFVLLIIRIKFACFL